MDALGHRHHAQELNRYQEAAAAASLRAHRGRHDTPGDPRDHHRAGDHPGSPGGTPHRRAHRRPALPLLAPLYRAEVGVATQLLHLLEGAPPWGALDPAKAIPWVEQQTGRTLAASQRAAVAQVLTGKVTVITGGPGVGKTTIVTSILQALRAKRMRVLLCAPTGRAAKRLSEATGLEAKTIHRLLEFDPKGTGFLHNATNPLDADLVVIDEVSMVDVVLMHQLLRAIPAEAAVLLVGDVDQLPSVGPGAVLADIIASGCHPDGDADRDFSPGRQLADYCQCASDQPRPDAGHARRTGDSDFYVITADTPEDIQAKLLRVVTERIPQRFGLDPIRDVQVLTPMNRGSLGARALNEALQAALNPEATPRVTKFGWTYAPGDKVIQTINDYDKDCLQRRHRAGGAGGPGGRGSRGQL